MKLAGFHLFMFNNKSPEKTQINNEVILSCAVVCAGASVPRSNIVVQK